MYQHNDRLHDDPSLPLVKTVRREVETVSTPGRNVYLPRCTHLSASPVTDDYHFAVDRLLHSSARGCCPGLSALS